MAIRMDSNTQEDFQQVIKHYGLENLPEAQAASEETPVSEPPSESKEEPGGEPAGEPKDKSAAPPEEVKTETTQEAPPVGETEDEKKRKSGWARKVEKLTAQVDAIREQLESERGNSRGLQERLEEAERRLADATGSEPEPEVEQGPVRPKRPKTPTLAEHDGDYEKWSAAMVQHDVLLDKYEEEMEQYRTQVTERAIAENSARAEQQLRENEIVRSFVDRRDAGKKILAESLDSEEVSWAELFGDGNGNPGIVRDSFMDAPADNPQGGAAAARDWINRKSKNPALLLYHFGLDSIHSGAENQRFRDMDAFDQIVELKALDERLGAEIAAKKNGRTEAAPPPRQERTPQQEPPARTQPRPAHRVPEPPIPTVGGHSIRATADSTAQLARLYEEGRKTGDMSAYRQAREQQRAAEVAAGRIRP